MRVTVSDFATYYRPSRCELRVFLRRKGEKEAEPSPYEEVLRSLGRQHELSHLISFSECANIESFPREQRVAATLDALTTRAPVVYQPAFVAHHRLAGTDLEIEGVPDLVLRDADSYIIRDVKMARRIDEEQPARGLTVEPPRAASSFPSIRHGSLLASSQWSDPSWTLAQSHR